MKAASLLRLYPREWRERYGDELMALVGDRSLSVRTTIDLIAGAIDARITKGTKMPSVLKSVCLTRNEPQTVADGLRGAAVIIVASLAFLGLAMIARRAGWPDTGDALAGISMPVSMVLMSHVMYLRKKSFAVKAVITGGSLVILAGISILSVL